MDEREDDDSEKTEEPTSERRKQFREQGNIPNIREVLSATSLCMFFLVFLTIGKLIVREISLNFGKAWLNMKIRDFNEHTVLKYVYQQFNGLLPFLIGSALLVTLFPLLTGLLFTQFNWSWKSLELNFDKINPVKGLQNVFSLKIFIELFRSIIKFIIVFSALFIIFRSHFFSLSSNIFMDIHSIILNVNSFFYEIIIAASISVIVIATADYGFNWWKKEQEMKMSHDEVRKELKNQEGDQQQKGQRRRMMREFIMRRSVKEVTKATFIITNPDHYAVAICYKKGMSAPIVVAKGQDFLALKIKEIAKLNDIITVENKPLARTLYKTLKIGQEIPPSLYSAVIEVMKYIYQIKGKDYFAKMELREAFF